MNRTIRAAAMAAAVACAGTSGASAQQVPATGVEIPQQTFKNLVARGFRVVATAAASGEMNRGGHAVVMVTLQKDRAVAVCTFGIGTWQGMTKPLEDDPSTCDVRAY